MGVYIDLGGEILERIFL